MKALQRITSLEAQLSNAIAAIEGLTRRISEAATVVANYHKLPSNAGTVEALAAASTLAAGNFIVSNFPDQKSWYAYVESEWVAANRITLLELLESVLAEKQAALADGAEDDVSGRESKLNAATAALKNFERAREMPGSYESLYQKFKKARDLVAGIEISEVIPLARKDAGASAT